MIRRAHRLIALSLMIFGGGVVWGQTTPTVTLTAACTAPCNAPTTITLSAAATVAAGRTVSKVEFYDGATLLTTDTTSPYSSTRTAVVGGSHSFTAKVYDNAATPLTAVSAAKVIAVNTAPTVTLVAACGANPCVAPATVTLTATPADVDGTISKVEFYRGATLVSTKVAAPWTFTDAALAAGTYSYTANAFDNAATPLSTTSTTQAITVATAPTVTLTAACTNPCNAPAAITLTATTTVGAGRAVSKVEFYEGATLLATDTTSPYSSARTAVTGGTRTYTAKVYDNATTPLTATSTVIAVAVNTAPTVSLAAVCNANPCNTPANVTLTAAPADVDGTISKVEFYRGVTLLATKTATPWTHNDAALAAGSYSYTAKAFDSATTALATTSTAQAITVVAPVTPPTVTLTAACTAPCNAPATITLSATTTVASGRTVSKVEFYEGATLLATDTTSPYSSARTSVTGGTHTYTAKVYDSGTTPLTASSTTIAIAVNTAPTVALTATCDASPCSTPATVTLNATPADSDGTISKVEFYRGATLIATTTAAPWTFSDAARPAGTFSYTAKTFDNAATPLATISAARSITVVAATSATYPIVIDGPSVTIDLPGSLPPQVKFSARAGDSLSLRTVNSAGPNTYTQGRWVLPPNSALFSELGYVVGTTLLFGWDEYLGNGGGHLHLLVLADGDYVIKLTNYGSNSQSLQISLLRAAPAIVVHPDGPAVTATTSRAGQPLQFQFSSATGFSHLACTLQDSPGWLDGDGNVAAADVRVFTPSLRTISGDNQGGDCINGQGTAYFSSSESGTYTMVITPKGLHTGGRTLALATPQPGPTLVINAAPIPWIATRQPVDGVRFTVPVVVGRNYTLVLSKGASLPNRYGSVRVQGIEPASYVQNVDFPGYFNTGDSSDQMTAKVRFTAKATDTIGISLIDLEEPPQTVPLLVSVAEDFAPIVTFTDPSANKMYAGVPYYNGVTVTGNGGIPIKSVSVTGYRAGWSLGYGTGIGGGSGAVQLPLAFSWPALTRDIYGLEAKTIVAVVTFANDTQAKTAELPLTYQLGPALIVDPVGLANNSTVDDDQISFQGVAVTDNQNTSVFVNDIRVPTVGGGPGTGSDYRDVGHFAVNNVPLTAGSNTVNIVVHQLSGSQTYTYVVNRASVTPKNFSAAIQNDWGESPLRSTITVNNLTGAPWQRVELVFPGSATPVVLAPGGGNVVTYSFTTSGADNGFTGGVVPVAITVFGANDQRLYRTTRYQSVVGMRDAGEAARAALRHLQDRMSAGDITGALQAFTDESLSKFRPLLQSLGASLSTMGSLGTFGAPIPSGPRAQMLVYRGNKVFRVLLMRDSVDGLWRIEDM